MNKEKQIEKIKHHFTEILNTLGFNLTKKNLQNTPQLIANMYVKEISKGLNLENKPKYNTINNNISNKIFIEKNIPLYSICEHHFVPFFGKIFVAYQSDFKFENKNAILQIIDFFAKKPQIQEKLTEEIAVELKKQLKTNNITIIIEAYHLCVSIRGIKDLSSTTITIHKDGIFKNYKIFKEKFLDKINKNI